MSQMKCPNCGAQMDVHPDKDFQFCSYCGTKVEKKDVPPETLAGAIYGIGKEWIKQQAKKEEQRQERIKEQEEYNRKHHTDAKIVIGCLFAMIGMPLLLLILSKFGLLPE